MGRTSFDLPFSYVVHGRRSHAREDRDYIVIDTIKTDIPDLSDIEVPVAAEIEGSKTVYRSFGGKPVLPLQGRDSWRRTQRLGAEEMTNWLQSRPALMPLTPPLGYAAINIPSGNDRDTVSADALRMTRVDQSNEETAREQALKYFSHLVFVDGQLHGLAPEPVYRVERDMAGRARIKIDSGFRHSVDTRLDARYRFDRLREAERYASHLYEKTIEGPTVVVDHGLIDWNFDEERDVCLILYHALLSRLTHSHLSYDWEYLPTDIFGVMHQLNRDVPLLELATQLEALVPQLRQFPTGHRAKSVCEPMAEAIAKWNDRIKLTPPPRARFEEAIPELDGVVL